MKLSVFLKYLVTSVLSMAAVRLANMADAALVAYVSRFIIYTDMTYLQETARLTMERSTASTR